MFSRKLSRIIPSRQASGDNLVHPRRRPNPARRPFRDAEGFCRHAPRREAHRHDQRLHFQCTAIRSSPPAETGAIDYASLAPEWIPPGGRSSFLRMRMTHVRLHRKSPTYIFRRADGQRRGRCPTETGVSREMSINYESQHTRVQSAPEKSDQRIVMTEQPKMTRLCRTS